MLSATSVPQALERYVDFNSILIGSENPDRLVEYYTKVLGEPGFSDGGYTGWQIGSGFITVGPHSEVKGKNAAPGRLIWNIETKDVAGEFARMKAAGAIVVTEPYAFPGAPNSSIATFADPDNNYFQLMTPMEMPS
jgi:predicted enzyme related to lactoylglutathione lyase